jgi:hypothetical protein
MRVCVKEAAYEVPRARPQRRKAYGSPRNLRWRARPRSIASAAQTSSTSVVFRIGACVVKCRGVEFTHKPVLLPIAQHRNEMLPNRIMLRPFFEESHGAQRLGMVGA